MTTANVLNEKTTDLNLPGDKQKRHFQVIQKTYQNNIDSDYTEKMESLGKNFDYNKNSNHFWGDRQLSTLYGTPLYNQASQAQKLALNHLYWVGQYQHTASAEANTMLYNQITSGVFTHVGGYETLCQELDFETSQERHHINTFHRIGYKTKLALLGKESFGNPLHKKLNNQTQKKLLPLPELPKKEAVQDFTYRFLTKLMHQGKDNYYSEYLKEKSESIPTATGGLAGVTASPSVFKYLSLNWGSSPFLAAQYYSVRMVANMSLKTYEYHYYKQFKELDKKGEFIPDPIAVSHYHLLDESFHTTMSQTIAQEVYKDFPKPTMYEKLLSNVIILLVQRGVLSGLSGALPATFRDDVNFIPAYYRLLTSPLFKMSQEDALYWMEKCLCEEHEGFHTNHKFHQTLLNDLRRFFGHLEYLWPVNREMRLMAEGGSIEKAIQRNQIAFKQFASSVAA
ncbi:MAG: hypothetical protein RMX96_26055 [Nostoc sp. ChiSLP02]|nr:hypothetical protein [Nostoc sp. DedSLP05]MDZ8101180.1 hypothetical protein [Nostoc sp. DedSLP01]MDZ8188306.1 hypothetical protein [Nostoc sp. ChiSLP02]